MLHQIIENSITPFLACMNNQDWIKTAFSLLNSVKQIASKVLQIFELKSTWMFLNGLNPFNSSENDIAISTLSSGLNRQEILPFIEFPYICHTDNNNNNNNNNNKKKCFWKERLEIVIKTKLCYLFISPQFVTAHPVMRFFLS